MYRALGTLLFAVDKAYQANSKQSGKSSVMYRLRRNTFVLLAIFISTAAILVLFYMFEEEPAPSILRFNAVVDDTVGHLVAFIQ